MMEEMPRTGANRHVLPFVMAGQRDDIIVT
jgi:hypothetical protein